jgi:hypothetical protein
MDIVTNSSKIYYLFIEIYKLIIIHKIEYKIQRYNFKLIVVILFNN